MFLYQFERVNTENMRFIGYAFLLTETWSRLKRYIFSTTNRIRHQFLRIWGLACPPLLLARSQFRSAVLDLH